jgi:tetratricopeptide (TPR) repeat protein
MSTKVKEALFELIRSMSKSEKRYFKLLASRHTIGDENNYVVLFDYIEKMPVYDEEQLFKHFKGEPFLNRFSITKKRLYDHLLHALDAYHATHSIDAQLHTQLHSAEILYNKSLYDQAKRILKSAEKLAKKNEKYVVLQQISKLNKRMLENEGYSDLSSLQILEIQAQDEELGKRIENSNILWTSKSLVFSKLHTKGVARTEEERLAYTKLIEHLVVPDSSAGFDERYLYNHLMSAYHYGIQDLNGCAVFLKKNLVLFEEDANRITQQLSTYLSLLTNAIYTLESLGQRTESNKLLQTLRKLPEDFGQVISEDMQIKLFASVNSVELGVHMKRGDFDQALKRVPQVELGLRTYENKITSVRRAFLCFKVATIYLGNGNSSEALKWINKIFNDPELDPSEDLLAFAYLVDLLIHMELKNNKLLPYAMKNAQRYLKSRNKLHRFEKVFLQFVSKMIKATDQFVELELWEDLLNEIRELNGEGLDKAALEYFDFELWAASKVLKKDFPGLLRDRNLTQLKSAS